MDDALRRDVGIALGSLAPIIVAALLARAPGVALVDELAHTNIPGSRNEKRWQDVEALLDAGINVVSTLNIQHLESLNDVVERITGIRQHDTIPDEVVRQAEQVELVDMTPEALRAHGDLLGVHIRSDEGLVGPSTGLLDEHRRLLEELGGKFHEVLTPPERRVRVEAGTFSGRLDLRVVDQGVGIPRPDRERLFQPFQRRGDHAVGGVGLELAVARGFLNAMAATIEIDDTPGGGTTIVISLPVAA